MRGVWYDVCCRVGYAIIEAAARFSKNGSFQICTFSSGKPRPGEEATSTFVWRGLALCSWKDFDCVICDQRPFEVRRQSRYQTGVRLAGETCGCVPKYPPTAFICCYGRWVRKRACYLGLHKESSLKIVTRRMIWNRIHTIQFCFYIAGVFPLGFT